MAIITRAIPENEQARATMGGSLPSTLGETLSAVISDPLLRPTQMGFQQREIGREAGERNAGGIFGVDVIGSVRDIVEEPPELLAPEDLNTEFGNLGLEFDRPVSRGYAELLAEGKRNEAIRADVIARGPTGFGATTAKFGAALAGAAIDPLNVASAFIPIVSEARYAGLVAKMGKTGARATTGMIEGFVGAAAIEPITYGLASQQQLDYEMSDALVNVGLGGFLGGGLHVVGGKLSDLISARSPEVRESALRSSVSQLMEGKRVDVDPVFKFDAMVHGDDFDFDDFAAGLGDPMAPLSDAPADPVAAQTSTLPDFLQGVKIDKMNYANGLNELADKAGILHPPGKSATEVVREFKAKYPELEGKPKDPLQGFVDTRATGERFHGTSTEIKKVSNDYYTTQNIYGQGFYTTDAVDIASGYTKKGKGKEAALYRVTEKEPVNFYDLERPIDDNFRAIVEGAAENDEWAIDLLDESASAREWLDNVRDESYGHGIPADEVQGLFDSVKFNLEAQGFGGYSHVGGLKTNRTAHDVKIYWQPETQIEINKISIDDFKQVAPQPPLRPDLIDKEEMRRQAAEITKNEARPERDITADFEAAARIREFNESGIGDDLGSEVDFSLEEVEVLRAAGLIDKADEAALKVVEGEISHAEGYARGAQAAARCLLR